MIGPILDKMESFGHDARTAGGIGQKSGPILARRGIETPRDPMLSVQEVRFMGVVIQAPREMVEDVA